MVNRRRDRDFLAWAHRQGGPCCLCGAPFDELHHFGSGGMARKGSDHLVARVCRSCHGRARKRIAMVRDGDWETYALMLEDAIGMLSDYHAGGTR